MFEVGARIESETYSYVIVQPHAMGGTSRTFRARRIVRTSDEVSDMEVLLKVSRLEGMRDWKTFERFEREVRTLAALSHPRIPKSFEVFGCRADGTFVAGQSTSNEEAPYAIVHVQELVVGRSLAQALRAGVRFSADELEGLYKDLLETLSYLHGLLPAVLHRDLQPENVVLGAGNVPYLIDFGLAVSPDAPAHSVALGAPGYVAPEVVLGMITPRADLYALAATVLTAASHIAGSEFPRDPKSGNVLVRTAAPGLPPHLARVLERSLEALPRKRPESAQATLRALSTRRTLRSLASRVSLGKNRGRIAAISALGFVLVASPLGWRAHVRAKAAQAAKTIEQLPTPSSQELPRACACGDDGTPSKQDTKAEAVPEATPEAPTTPAPREFVSWLAVPVQTSKGAGAPKLTDKCALRVESEALGCSAHLACGTEESTVFRQTFEGSALDKSEGCQIEQVADVLPNHFRYQVRAFTSNGNTIYIDTREGVVRYESGDAHLRFKLIDAGPTSTVRVPANLLSTPSALREPLRLQGRVASVTGVAPVPHGASCTAKIDPDHTTSNNCQIEVSCGGKVLYRNASASCALSDNGAVSFRDAAPTLLDGTPTLSVTEGGSFGIGDESSTGGWSVGVEPLRD